MWNYYYDSVRDEAGEHWAEYQDYLDKNLSTEMQQDRSEVNLWLFKSLFYFMNGVISYLYSYL